MKRLNVLHIIDTLAAGGAERVAVNLVNHLSRERYGAHLCTTRDEGPLAAHVAADVARLRLTRRGRFDFAALRTLRAYVRQNRIQLIHAHSTSVFLAALACPHTPIVWHEHYGRFAEARPALAYRVIARRVSGLIAVNEALAEWALQNLHIAAERIWYLPNFVSAPETTHTPPELPGSEGARVICVANLRAEKDQLTLLRAFALLAQQFPTAHLLLAGAAHDTAYYSAIKQELSRLQLAPRVTLLGLRDDVPALLSACDIGVLSSVAEGFPISLLEYGRAGLPVIATQVGQCAEVLNNGQAGLLVAPSAPEQLAAALATLLNDAARRRELGARLQQRVQECYSPRPVLAQLGRIYEALAAEGKQQAVSSAPLPPTSRPALGK